MKKIFFFLLLINLFIACSTESSNLSPISKNFTGDSSTKEVYSNYMRSLKSIPYAAKATHLLSELPEFKIPKVEGEVKKIKQTTLEYIDAVKKSDAIKRKAALKQFSVSLQNIQKLKKTIPEEQGELLDRYVTQVKTNISRIDSINITLP